jgi:hypothetical protein
MRGQPDEEQAVKDTNAKLASRPYLAICEDRPDDPEGFLWTLYLVNEGEEAIEDLVVDSIGFAGGYDELIQTSPASKRLGTLPAGAAVEVEQNDLGEFDFMVIFTARGRTGRGAAVEGSFTRHKGAAAEPTRWIPVLEREGVVIRGEWS